MKKQKKKKKMMMMMMFFENVKHSECLSSLSLLARDVDSMLERERETGEPHLPLLRRILFTPGRGIQGE